MSAFMIEQRIRAQMAARARQEGTKAIANIKARLQKDYEAAGMKPEAIEAALVDYEAMEMAALDDLVREMRFGFSG
jgi:hypothetical protein